MSIYNLIITAHQVTVDMLAAGLSEEDIDNLCQMIYYSDAGMDNPDGDHHWDPLDVLTRIVGHSPDWKQIWYDEEMHICFKLVVVGDEREWTYT